ncbi:MAG TPA: glycosyltransferase family 2 protein [Anaeromyxobacter sp.]|nr:glycosyltransferase family 2 protein [Anaeromyxobacter sp.]
MPALSAVIITKNEERNLPRTLAPLTFADEVLVVDSGSTDRTATLARSLGARVLEHPFLGDGPQKRWAAAQARHDWILGLDADEVLDAELAGAIRSLLAQSQPACAAYSLRYITIFMGQPLRHGPESRRRHIRLFDRRRAGWTEATVHGQVVTDGPVGALPGAVLHYTIRDLSDSVAKMNLYSSMGAAEVVRRGKRRSAAALVLTAPVQFLRHYLLLQNFRNGIPGLAWSFMNAMGSTMKYLKARELQGSSPPAEGPP